MAIETITENIQTRTYQTSNCKHCGERIERTIIYEQKGCEPRCGNWYHSKSDKHKWSKKECDDTGAQPPRELPIVKCENCGEPLYYQEPLDERSSEWLHVATNDWFCNSSRAEPD